MTIILVNDKISLKNYSGIRSYDIPYKDKKPTIDKTCYISESVDIIGEVIIEENVNI
mgnify:FL=1